MTTTNHPLLRAIARHLLRPEPIQPRPRRPHEVALRDELRAPTLAPEIPAAVHEAAHTRRRFGKRRIK
jgi:hypothetical protein